MNILKIKRALAELVWTGALLFAAASVFLRPGAAAGGVLRGLSVCYETVIPALFPFLVLSRLLLESRAASALGLLLRPYTRLLGLHSPKAPAAMLCGVLGGFAGGKKREQRYIAAQHHDGVDRVPYGGNKTRLRRNGVRLCFLRDGTAAGGHAFARLRCAGHGGPETARHAAAFAQANKKCGGQPADK